MTDSGTARAALLDAIVEQFVTNGIADFSLRSLALDLGTSHQLLLYHFGNRESLLRAALDRIQTSVVDDLDRYLDGHPERRRPSKIWQHLSRPGPGRLLVQYQCLGLAMIDPGRYADIGAAIQRGWTVVANRLLADHALDRGQRDAVATLLVASLRGLGLDLMATGERSRISRAAAQLDRVFDDLVARQRTPSTMNTRARATPARRPRATA